MAQESSNKHARAVWKERLSPYAKPDQRSAIFQLVSTLALFFLTWWLMLKSLATGWWLTLLIAPIASLLLVRLFIIQHDCGHGSYFSSNRANGIVGFFLGVLSLTPFAYWKRTHAIHHSTSGNLDKRTMGDIETLTVAEYMELPWWRKLSYRLYRHPLIMFGIGPIYQFMLKHRLPLDAPLSWTREWRSVMLTNLCLLVVAVGMVQTVGLKNFLMVQLPINLIAGPIGIWMFYMQHQFEGTYWARNDEWDVVDAALKGSSFYDLPAVFHWFTGNIGFHHVHHLSSRIPNYRLQKCYCDIQELQHPPRIGLLESLGCLRLRLWDEAQERLVGFSQLGRGVTDPQ